MQICYDVLLPWITQGTLDDIKQKIDQIWHCEIVRELIALHWEGALCCFYWGCTKAVLRLFWGCTEAVLRLLRCSSCSLLSLIDDCFDNSLEHIYTKLCNKVPSLDHFYRGCAEAVLRLHWGRSEAALRPFWGCYAALAAVYQVLLMTASIILQSISIQSYVIKSPP